VILLREGKPIGGSKNPIRTRHPLSNLLTNKKIASRLGTSKKGTTMTDIALTIPPGFKTLCDSLYDTEGLRKSVNNRLNAMTRDGADADGIIRGLGLPEDDPMVVNTKALADALLGAEAATIKEIEKFVKKSIYRDFVKNNLGMGAKTVGRLLGALGDPYIATIHVKDDKGEPTGEKILRTRTLRELWAYSGYAVDNGEARRRKKGMTQEDAFALGNPQIKMRVFLLAESAMKAGKGKVVGNKFRLIYEADKLRSENALHNVACVRCGTSGKPAQPGTPLKDAHRHAQALRRVSKEILRDLWLIAKAYHEEQGHVEVAEQTELVTI